MLRFQIFQHVANGKFYFFLRSPENEILLCGEDFISKQSCVSAIIAVKQNANNHSLYYRKKDSYSFYLRTAEGALIGCGEELSSEKEREHVIDIIKKHASSAAIEDLT